MSDNATAIIFLILTPIGILLFVDTYCLIRLKYVKLLNAELKNAVDAINAVVDLKQDKKDKGGIR